MVLICLQGDTVRFKAFWSVARTFIKASAFLSAVITAFSFSRAQMELRKKSPVELRLQEKKETLRNKTRQLGKKLFLSVIAMGVYLLLITSILSCFLLLPKPVFPKNDFLSHPADLTNIIDG